MKFRLVEFVLLVSLVVASACASAAPTSVRSKGAGPGSTGSGTPLSSAGYPGLNLAALGSYQARFEINFTGAQSWRYVLVTRSDGRLVEYSLHIEGPAAARNPGDVRLVTDGAVSRMIGAGTENECVLFPSDLDLGPAFLSPDALVEPGQADAVLQSAPDGTLLGRAVQRLSAQPGALAGWDDVRLNLSRTPAEGAVLSYDLLLAGTDPYFEGGEGLLAGQFRVEAIGPQAIEPISGCEISLPVPADASRLVRLPGLVAYDSPSSAELLVAFYQTQLPGTGWQPAAEPQAGGDAIALAYTRGSETLEVNLETRLAGTHVELLTP